MLTWSPSMVLAVWFHRSEIPRDQRPTSGDFQTRQAHPALHTRTVGLCQRTTMSPTRLGRDREDCGMRYLLSDSCSCRATGWQVASFSSAGAATVCFTAFSSGGGSAVPTDAGWFRSGEPKSCSSRFCHLHPGTRCPEWQRRDVWPCGRSSRRTTMLSSSFHRRGMTWQI
jgi:hypothetical protein